MPVTNYLPSSRLIQPGVCTSSTRPASPFEGMAIFETDTDRMLIWNGSTWVVPNAPAQNPTGLELITACTVSSVGGTAATASNGIITIGAGNTSITVSNAFSSDYRIYRLVFEWRGSAQATTLLQMGTTAANYYGSQYYDGFTGSATGTLRRNNGINWQLSQIGTFAGENSCTIDLSCPQLATRTSFSGTYYGGIYSGWTSGQLADTTQYTSFTLTIDTGSYQSGTIQVYGYRK